ncbi:MAG: aminotransferase [Alphaproteobacteria bacterium]|nr:aminotransferase [Alphaproteobacteria bacterium]HPF45444.1 aminotransferase [Emcibacteraceae bacterium]
MKIREFGVEIWMNEFENHCKYNLAETCVQSLTIDELLKITDKKEAALSELLPLKMTYGAIEGSARLKNAISTLYDNQKPENIMVAHGAIGANALVYSALVGPKDEVITVLPTYQQHYSIPESFGAKVKVLQLREEDNFLPNLDDLKSMVSAKTKLISVNNPNNPTGALISEEILNEIADIARTCDAYLLCDEVYRGTDQEGSGFTKSIADIYEKGISTGSMSKSFSLAGLRVGWIAAPREVLESISIHRDYNTISVSIIDDYFAAIALENKHKIIARSQKITRENLKILDNWVTNEPLISYVRPKSGTTALLKYDLDLRSRDLCIRLLNETGVMLTPGSVMDMEGYLRMGYANSAEILKTGLGKISEFLGSQG